MGKKIKLWCIKSIILVGEDDMLPSTLPVELGEIVTVRQYADGDCCIDKGTEWYDISPELIGKYFVIQEKRTDG
jgi:hypothetical protein